MEELQLQSLNKQNENQRVFMGNNSKKITIKSKDSIEHAPHRECSKGKLYIIGIGPGSINHVSIHAKEILDKSEFVLGNGTYLDQIKGILNTNKSQKIIRSSMGKEVDRATKSVELAKNHIVSIISGGDANIYGMAGLVFEVAETHNLKVDIEVIPGITSISACASILGAPIINDFATISLSNLLTPWEVIEKRLDAAASSDFILSLYNPKSRGRKSLFSKSIEIIKKYREDSVPVGLVKNALRDNFKQDSIITTLGNVLEYNEWVDMRTTIIIGTMDSHIWDNGANKKIITKRGYHRKYEYSAHHFNTNSSKDEYKKHSQTLNSLENAHLENKSKDFSGMIDVSKSLGLEYDQKLIDECKDIGAKTTEAKAISSKSRNIARLFVGDNTLEDRIRQRCMIATGDSTLAHLMQFNNNSIEAGLFALKKGMPIFVDINMVKSGILKSNHNSDIICVLDMDDDAKIAQKHEITRTAAGFLSCFDKLNGAIVVIGNAPSALLTVCKLVEKGIRPALVIGTPVGFVNAAESKEVLRNTNIPSISNIGTRGGTPIAVACINELISILSEEKS